MTRNKMSRIKVLGFLGIPALAFALAMVLLGTMGNHSARPVSADTTSVGLDTSMGIDLDGAPDKIKTNDDCDTKPATTSVPAKCTVTLGSTFTVAYYINSLNAKTTADYDGIQFHITYTGVTSKDDFPTAAAGYQWAECSFPAFLYGAGDILAGCGEGVGAPDSAPTGHIVSSTFNCDESGSITMVNGATDTNVSDAGTSYFDPGGNETLTINCLAPTATRTFTPTFTPTNTPTNTPTATPPPVPRWMKQQRYPFTDADSQCDTPGIPVGCDTAQDPAKDDLGNLWLTRQGTKIPPLNCLQSSDNAVFSEVLQFTPLVPDSKGVHEFAFIGGFEFEVRFDPKVICVNLVPGEAAKELGLLCFVDDKDEGIYQGTLEGIARMGCVSKGKNKFFPDEFKDKGPELAQVWIKPQPELYSQIRPNQDNGVVVQLLDQDCELTDEQGHPIPIFSCEDAAVTIRYLEGDVEPDCQVDALDFQNNAFRWGANLGSLIYNQRFDLEPSGAIKGDGDIDIKDLQFMFGRAGSTCGRTVDDNQGTPGGLGPNDLKDLPEDAGGPHPRQEPRNPNQ